MGTTASGFIYPDAGYTSGVRQAIQDLADSAEDVIREAGIPRFADSAARAAAIPSPTQGMRSSLDTLPGITFVYYAVYNSVSNPGGTNVAGWYPAPGSALACILSRTASFTTAVEADIDTWTEDSDPWGWHSTSSNTNRVTPLYGGFYQVSLFSVWASNVTGNRLTRTRKNNGDTVTDGAVQTDKTGAGASGQAPTTAVTIIKCNGSTDYINFRGYQNSGGALNGTFRAVVAYVGPPVGP